MKDNVRLMLAEFVGTAVLVIGGPGSAILAGDAIGTLGISIAFGLSLLIMVYTIGNVSGCHINPAVTVGLWFLGKTKSAQVPWYLIGQVVGGIFGAFLIWVIANGLEGFSAEASGFASNGYGENSPEGYPLWSVIITEIVITMIFVLVVASSTRKSMAAPMTGLSVGLALALVHLVTIPVDNTSVNPARSLATAVFQTTWALEQVWVFIVFPLIGGVLAGAMWKALVPADDL